MLRYGIKIALLTVYFKSCVDVHMYKLHSPTVRRIYKVHRKNKTKSWVIYKNFLMRFFETFNCHVAICTNQNDSILEVKIAKLF